MPAERVRVVVRDLPGWPQSASALLDWVLARITRLDLLHIADDDPFGAHKHFPILVKIWMSRRVPPMLSFNPGEALELYRWSSGPRVDHLGRALCCTLLCISGGTYIDDHDPASIVPALVESCLALGGDAPALAAQLLAWYAVSEPASQLYPSVHRYPPHPVALLGLVVLAAVADPDDPRLADLVAAVADAFTEPDTGREVPQVLANACGHADTWLRLFTTILEPWRAARPDVDRLVAVVLRTAPPPRRPNRTARKYGQPHDQGHLR